MEINRRAGQGLLSIIRFNWPFYLAGSTMLFVALLLLCCGLFPPTVFLMMFILVLSYAVLGSLFVSFYIYDCSNLYQLPWLREKGQHCILTVNAGFDETSQILRKKLPNAKLVVCDFYNPSKHTEASIRRARKAFPPDRETISIETESLPFVAESFDAVYAILSAHEIRNEEERVQFFKELNRATKKSGEIYITEHLRDWKNFLAYTIGFFHFHSRQTWLHTFDRAGLTVEKEIKITPFLTTFVVRRNGNTR